VARTARIVELLQAMTERPWTAEEQREVEMIIGDDEGRKQYEIEGEYSQEGGKPKAYDRPPAERSPMPKDATPTSREAVPWNDSGIEIRLAQLEATVKELFAKLRALEDKLGVGKE
jgi:hypothetical protein